MFASEKVMLDYLGQLLNEDENANDVVGRQTDANKLDESDANVNHVIKKTQPVHTKLPTEQIKNEQPVESLKPKPQSQLRPIVSAVSQFKEYKEEPKIALAEPNSVEKLLQQVEDKEEFEKNIKEEVKRVDLVSTQTDIQTKVEESVDVAPEKVVEETFPDEPFQALFFEVAGLVLAVPLQDLGAIHNLTEVNSLFGKPKWFKGVMLNRDKKLNVVDSARWVMPEKYGATMESTIDYKYLITLGESNWGLMAERLVETETILPSAVKWRNGQGKRPWLLGTIKEKMCALLHVSDLIAMLEQGIDARHE